MTKFNLLAVCAISLGLAACTTSNGSRPSAREVAPQVAAPALGDDEVLSHFGVLPPQNLSAGECGLFLWLKRDDAPLVFFQTSDSNATMMIDGKEAQLSRTAQQGRIALEYFEKQSFESSGLTLDVAVTPEEKRSLQQGLKLPAGAISVETADGWSAVLPVVGLIGCK